MTQVLAEKIALEIPSLPELMFLKSLRTVSACRRADSEEEEEENCMDMMQKPEVAQNRKSSGHRRKKKADNELYD